MYGLLLTHAPLNHNRPLGMGVRWGVGGGGGGGEGGLMVTSFNSFWNTLPPFSWYEIAVLHLFIVC